MNKIALGKTGMQVSKIIYGGIVSTDEAQDASDAHVAYAIEHGINYFDVAPKYGDAQLKMGNSLVPYRNDVYLACKSNKRDGENAKREMEESLNLLHTDHFDVYQIHELASVEEVERACSNDGILPVMQKAKEEGIIKHLGISCHNDAAALRALELFDFETVLFPTNWGLNMAKGFGTPIAEKIAEKGIGFLGMKSMIHRAWIGDERQHSRFPKSWCKPISENDALTIAAIRYAYALGAQVIVPPGNFENFSFAVEHCDEVCAPLTDADRAILAEALPSVGEHFFF